MEKIRTDLRGWNLGQAMPVADSGRNLETNRTERSKACGKCLLTCRMGSIAGIKRDVRVTKANLIRIGRGAIKEAAKYDGKWVIETNDDTISLEDAARGYRELITIERCFRTL